MLLEKINQNLITAQKSKDELVLTCLRMLKSAIKYVAIQKMKESLEDSEIVDVIRKQINQRKDSVNAFRSGNRLDLAQKEEKEIEILSAYLPAAPSAEEITQAIQEAIAKTQAKSKADKGKVIKEVMTKLQGRAEGSQISQLVDQRLS
jgi:uncharacterized protein YqeY